MESLKKNLKDEECAKKCKDFGPEFVENLEKNEEESECSGYDEQKCKYYFAYYYKDGGNLKLKLQRNEECPLPTYILIIILVVIILVILVALLLLWKLLKNLREKREFNRLNRERLMANWSTVSI